MLSIIKREVHLALTALWRWNQNSLTSTVTKL